MLKSCRRAAVAAAALVLSAATAAQAQQIQLTGPISAAPAVREEAYSSQLSRTSNAIVMPSGQMEVAGEMAFVTADPWLSHAGIRFSDMALFRARARRALSNRLELYLGTELLAKQPADIDEPVWQGANGGMTLAFSRVFAAQLDAGGGPLLDHAGWYWRAAPRLLAKTAIGDYVRFALHAGDSFTVLERKPRRAWLEELGVGGEAEWGDRHGALWLGIDYAVPIGWGPRSSAAHPPPGYLAPRVRTGLGVGGVLSVSRKGWDLYATYSIIDRGEANQPATTLPILDGGFDQRQLIIGVEHRFGENKRRGYQ